MDTSHKVAFITGGATRVGAAIALHLAHLGYDIALHYRSSQKDAEHTAAAIQLTSRKCILLQGDLLDLDSTATLIARAQKELGTITCLINNASMFEKDTLQNFTPENFTQHFAVHAQAPLLLIREFARQLPEGEHGNIINLTDGMVGWSMSDTFLTYSLSKMTLHNITQLLARSLAPRIRINTIAPGATLKGEKDKPETFSKLEKFVPLQHTSNPNEVCDAVEYLLKAHSVTGQIISLGGGIHTLQSLYE